MMTCLDRLVFFLSWQPKCDTKGVISGFNLRMGVGGVETEDISSWGPSQDWGPFKTPKSVAEA